MGTEDRIRVNNNVVFSIAYDPDTIDTQFWADFNGTLDKSEQVSAVYLRNLTSFAPSSSPSGGPTFIPEPLSSLSLEPTGMPVLSLEPSTEFPTFSPSTSPSGDGSGAR